MKLSCLSALVIIPFSVSSQLHASAPEAQCYPLVHGEEGMGSTNSLFLPHLLTDNAWSFYVTLTNTSEKFVNVKLRFNAYDGNAYTPQQVVYYGSFSAVNSPLLPSLSGAVLKPNETARVRILDDSNSEALQGRVSWQADSCISSALLVSVRSHYSTSTRFGSDIRLLNNGQPF